MAVYAVQIEDRKRNIELLNEIIEDSVKKIDAIDTALEELVQGGLKGSAVATMSKTYITNRERISDLLKEFAKYSKELQTQEERNAQVDEQAEQNATGTPIE